MDKEKFIKELCQNNPPLSKRRDNEDSTFTYANDVLGRLRISEFDENMNGAEKVLGD